VANIIIGNIYGKLTVKDLAHKTNYRKFFNCICECGKETVVYMNHLKSGHTTSCGCNKGSSPIHGYAGTKLYKVYYTMLDRCHNPKASGYPKYGAKGIKVCKPWKDSFEEFLKWAVDYEEGLTIDRIDTTKGYSPENCRWTTSKVQMANRPSRSNSGHKYIHWSKSKNVWVIKVLGKQISTSSDLNTAINIRDTYLKQNGLTEEYRSTRYEIT